MLTMAMGTSKIDARQGRDAVEAPVGRCVEDVVAVHRGEPPASVVAVVGVAPVSTVTDTWTTANPKPDATNLSSLPKAVANAIDGKDHSEDPEFPDQGGRVMDEAAAGLRPSARATASASAASSGSRCSEASATTSSAPLKGRRAWPSRPMGTGVGVGVGGCPPMDVVCEMRRQRAATREVPLPNEQDGDARLVGGDPLGEDQAEVGEVLGHDHPVLLGGGRVDDGVVRLSKAGGGHAERIVTELLQMIGDRRWKHLVDQPPHDDRRRSRFSTSWRTRSAACSSASIRRSIS